MSPTFENSKLTSKWTQPRTSQSQASATSAKDGVTPWHSVAEDGTWPGNKLNWDSLVSLIVTSHKHKATTHENLSWLSIQDWCKMDNAWNDHGYFGFPLLGKRHQPLFSRSWRLFRRRFPIKHIEKTYLISSQVCPFHLWSAYHQRYLKFRWFRGVSSCDECWK